jgi:hypothetical protein
MQGHIPAEERPIGTGGIVLPERSIPSLGDRPASEHLKARPEHARRGGGDLRADAKATDVPPSKSWKGLYRSTVTRLPMMGSTHTCQRETSSRLGVVTVCEKVPSLALRSGGGLLTPISA